MENALERAPFGPRLSGGVAVATTEGAAAAAAAEENEALPPGEPSNMEMKPELGCERSECARLALASTGDTERTNEMERITGIEEYEDNGTQE